jgi:hypothetical protein
MSPETWSNTGSQNMLQECNKVCIRMRGRVGGGDGQKGWYPTFHGSGSTGMRNQIRLLTHRKVREPRLIHISYHGTGIR